MDNNLQDMFEIRTSHYRPLRRGLSPFFYPNRPPFTISAVDAMLHDPQVKLGVGMLKAPLSKALFHVEAKDRSVVDFVSNTIKRIWDRSSNDILDAMLYTRAGGEVVYCREDNTIQFDAFRAIHPLDCRILTRGGMKYGLKVCNLNGTDDKTNDIYLTGAKSFIYIHKRKFSGWEGQSELLAAYQPWLDKHDRFGALAVRRLWFYKNAFGGGILFHPPGNYTYQGSNGEQLQIPYRDLARQAIEAAQTGAVWTFDSVFGENGQRLWEFVQPQIHGGSVELLTYVKDIDTEIFRGMGITDDVVSQVSGTGSFAGRTIPLQAFFISLNETLKQVVNAIREQVIDYLVRMNFGYGIRYDLGAEINTDALLPTPPAKENSPKEIVPVESPSLATAA